MTVISTKRNHPHRTRRLAYAPLIAVIVAGTVCAGAGIGSAATDTDVSSSQDNELRVWNHTDQSFRVHVGKTGPRASGQLTANLLPYGHASSDLSRGTATRDYSYVSVCLAHHLWESQFSTPGDHWNDIHIFADRGKPFVTPEGAYDNHPLIDEGHSC